MGSLPLHLCSGHVAPYSGEVNSTLLEAVMAVVFTRIRSRDLGTTTAKQSWYSNDSSLSCKETKWSFQASRSNSRTLVNKEEIHDFLGAPKGYHKGDFKITSVMRKKMTCYATPIEASLKEPACSNGTRILKLKGTYTFPYAFSPADGFPVHPTFSQNDINRLCRNALARAKASDVGLGESLGEYKETVRAFRKPLHGLRSLLSASLFSRKGSLRKLRDASSLWLEFRYGWAPLVGTINDLIKKRHNITDGAIYESFAKERVTLQSTNSIYSRIKNSGTYLKAEGTVQTVTTKRGVVYYRVRDANELTRVRYGMAPIWSVPALAWEFTRLSFVVDWWFNVGNFIQWMTPAPYIEILGYTYSEKISKSSQSLLTGIGLSSGVQETASGAAFEELLSYRREVVEPAIIGLPDFSSEFKSVLHAVDSLGLIIQSLPNRAKRLRK